MNIYQRINEVRKKVPYIQKDAAVQGYKAVTHDMVTAKLRDALIAHGVIIIPSVRSGVSTPAGQTSKGTPIIRYESEVLVTFVNIDDPQESFASVIHAHANDQGDKAPGKALSYAVKYAMLKVFNLETGENEESRVEDERKAATITAEQVEELRELLGKYGKSEKEFAEYIQRVHRMRLGSVEEMRQGLYEWSVNFLRKKIQEAANGTAD